MRVQARIITKADELAMNFEGAYVFFDLISKKPSRDPGANR
jgi:hypothetical protein